MDLENRFNYRETLNEYLQIKKEVNREYSLRAFARDLGIASSNLSNILNGKQGLSKYSALQIASRLKIEGRDREIFINSVLASDARSKKEKILARAQLKKFELDSGKRELQEDYFKLISEWHYYAILELLTLEEFSSDYVWVSETLGLEVFVVKKSFERLERLGLVEKGADGYKSTGVQLETLNDYPSVSIKKHNAQILAKANDALLNQSVLEREFTTLTIAINKDDINFVKMRFEILS